ncbi:NAD-dependent epimerase/dehydratase family protein [Bacillus wiedmannii]|uniref:NAD-dependent epimerase/dehydratase family protein n=1 Tax=Bacillus wiedmannii TaxID=1890302 RepID=UPI003D992CA4
MKIFLAGSTGVIGRSLIPMLVQQGHEVFGMIRSESDAEILQKLGAKSVVADAFDRDSVYDALNETKPDVVIHQLTSLNSGDSNANARIRKEGTRNLVDAAIRVGVKKMIAQSISWAYEPGHTFATEETPLDFNAPLPRKTTIDGILALEDKVSQMPEFVILRYGTLYGPGTWYSKDGKIAEQLHKQELFATNGITSFLHVEDAARAAVLALDWSSGAVNIVDDEPVKGTVWLPYFAEVVGVPHPKAQDSHNLWERGVSNCKAKNECGWTPIHSSWREGFKH